MNRILGLALTVVFLAGSAPAGAQERPALYEALELSGNFSPDPVVVEVEAGGDTNAVTFDGACAGMVNAEGPDITIDLAQPKAPLNIYALSRSDVTLAVRRPNGDWTCDDDSDGTNPWVRLAKPASGRYAIWVGLVEGEDFAPATVLISEADPDWNYGGGSDSDAGDEATAAVRERPVIPFAVEAGTRAEAIARAAVGTIQALLGSDPQGLMLDVDAPVTAADDGGTVRVTLPGAQLDSGVNGRFLLGDLIVAVAPRDGGRYDVAVAVPTRVEVAQGDDLLGTIELGAATLSGSWSATLQSLLNLQGALSDITVTDLSGGQPEVKARIGAIDLSHSMAAGAGGLWQGPYRVELRGTELHEGEGNAVSLGSLLFEGSFEGVDLAGWAAIVETFGVSPFPFQPMVDSERQADFAQAMTALNWGRMESRVSLADLRLTDAGEEAFRLGELGLRWQLDAREEYGDLGFGFSAGGFSIDLPDVPAELKPRRLSIDVLMRRVPAKALYMAAVPSGGNGAGADPGELLGVLFQGEPSLSLTSLIVQTAALDLAARGDVASTANGPRGSVAATVKGLAKTIEAMQRGGEGLPGVAEALPVLTALRDLQGAASAGGAETVHSYKIELADDGRLTVNGKPFEEIMP